VQHPPPSLNERDQTIIARRGETEEGRDDTQDGPTQQTSRAAGRQPGTGGDWHRRLIVRGGWAMRSGSLRAFRPALFSPCLHATLPRVRRLDLGGPLSEETPLGVGRAADVVGVGVHIVAVPGLARAAMAAAVVCDRAEPVREEAQLVVPRVGDEALIDPPADQAYGAGLQRDARGRHDRRFVARAAGARPA
jgi:hypothetical protein